jgi:hypothetical protein
VRGQRALGEGRTQALRVRRACTWVGSQLLLQLRHARHRCHERGVVDAHVLHAGRQRAREHVPPTARQACWALCSMVVACAAVPSAD